MLCLSFGTLILVSSIFIYLSFKSETTLFWLGIAVILLGIGNAGTNLGISDASISYVPEKDSSIYIAILNISRFCFSGLAALIAGFTLTFLEKFTSNEFGYFFIITIILFCCSCVIISRMDATIKINNIKGD